MRAVPPRAAAPDPAPYATAENDRTRGLMVGIAAGNLLGIVQEGWSRRRVAEAYPDGVREIAATTGYPDDDDLAQAIVIAEAAAQGQLDPDDLGRRFWEWAETNGLGMGGLTGHVLELYGGDAPQFLAATRQHGRVRTPVACIRSHTVASRSGSDNLEPTAP